MNNQHEDQLRQALRSQAERGAPHELDLDSVTATARGIRRRRTALAAFSTAAVIALAVPAGMALTGTFDSEDAPPVAGQSPSQTPLQAPTGELVEVSLLGDVEGGGQPAARPYVKAGSIVAPGGDRVEVGGDGTPAGVDVLGERWLVLKDLGEGRYALDTVTESGEVESSVPARSGPVMSADGTVAAYVAGNGDIHTITATDGDLSIAAADRVGDVDQISAVVGSGTCEEAQSEQGGCTVVAELGAGGVRYATSNGTVDDLPGFRSVADVVDDQVLGMVSADDFGSCSALRGLSGGDQAWRTCDNSFGKVSPDGRYAFGLPAYLDGLGPRSVSIVDMADGRELVRFADTGQGMSAIFDIAWESDSTLLVTVWDGDEDSWLLLRAGIDGSLSEVDSVTGAGDPLVDGGPAIRLG